MPVFLSPGFPLPWIPASNNGAGRCSLSDGPDSDDSFEPDELGGELGSVSAEAAAARDPELEPCVTEIDASISVLYACRCDLTFASEE